MPPVPKPSPLLFLLLTFSGWVNQHPRQVIDYLMEPEFKHEDWPQILSNKQRLSKFIYNETRDWMWKVSAVNDGVSWVTLKVVW